MKGKGQKDNGRNVGRPRVITAAVVEEVSALMAKGVPEEFACSLCGVNPETYGPAVSRNPEFKNIARRHHAEYIAESMDIIKAGGEKVQLLAGEDKEGNPIYAEKIMPWTGRAWVLERRYKPHFNRTEVVKGKEDPGERGGLLNEQDMLELEKAVKQQLKEKGEV